MFILFWLWAIRSGETHQIQATFFNFFNKKKMTDNFIIMYNTPLSINQ